MTESMSEEQAKQKAKDRDGWECRFCGMSNEEHIAEYDRGLHAHHIVKQSDGGADHLNNLITVCRDCHNTLEHTQARGLSNLLKAEKLKQERDIGDNSPPTVEIGETYEHKDYGTVYVGGIDSEVVGATPDSVEKDITVRFRRRDAPSQSQDLTAGIVAFMNRIDDLETELTRQHERMERR